MIKRTIKANHSTAHNQARATLYPIIEDIITKNTSKEYPYISKDDIARHLISHPVACQIIIFSLKEEFHNDNDIWVKSANYVDFLNRDITRLDSLSKQWNDGFYARKRSQACHPVTNKFREIWFMSINNSTINEDLEEITTQTNFLSTEKLQNIKTRIGQGVFRESLINYWKECAVTQCSEIGLLRASHIKPWRYANDLERLDVFNGLLLIPNLDAAFDKGYISFDIQGKILISPCLQPEEIAILGITADMRVKLTDRHQSYMQYHRESRYKK